MLCRESCLVVASVPGRFFFNRTKLKNTVYRVIFGEQNIRGSAILRHFVGNIFVVAACTAGKGRQGRFIRG